MDGINVDFEALAEEEAPHFIQFIRDYLWLAERTVWCCP